MGFGGASHAMQKSIQDNRALVRGRNSLFERPVTRSRNYGDDIVKAEPVPPGTRARFIQKLAQEKRTDRLKYLASVLLTIALIIGIYYFGDDLYRLMPGQ